jgi:hypothetical protein
MGWFAESPMLFAATVEAALSANPGLSSMPIRQRFCDMRPADRIGPGKIRNRARDPHYARSATTGQTQLIHRIFDQSYRVGRECDGVALDLRIARRTRGAVPVTNRLPGTFDPFRDDGAWLATWRTREFRGSGWLHFDREVDPVKHRTADAVTIVLTAAGCMAAFPSGISEIPAAARVHCCHQLEPCRVGYVCRGP